MIFSDSSILRTQTPNNGVINGDNKTYKQNITITVQIYQKMSSVGFSAYRCSVGLTDAEGRHECVQYMPSCQWN